MDRGHRIPLLASGCDGRPLIERCGRVLFLLSSAQETRYVEPGLPAVELEDFCSQHELRTEFRIVAPPPRAESLMEAAGARHAELLVAAHGAHHLRTARAAPGDRGFPATKPDPRLRVL